MNLEVKDIKELDILAESLAWISKDNDFAVHIFENLKNPTDEEQNAYWSLMAKRKRIDDLIEKVNKLISENRPKVNYVKYVKYEGKKS